MSAPLVYGLSVLWLVLAAATLPVFIINKIKNSAESKNVMLRVKSWWIIILIFTIVFFAGKPWAYFIFAFVAVLALREIYLKTASAGPSAGIKIFPIFIFIITLVSVLSWGLLFAMPGGAEYFFMAAVITQFNDIAQYLWGKSVGRRRIAPGISPSKTWGGFSGGVFTSALLAVLIAPYYAGIKGTAALFAGVTLAVFGFMGDLTVSAFKRALKTKDMGALIPGHGGVMDRIDSLLYNIPLCLAFMVFYNKLL